MGSSALSLKNDFDAASLDNDPTQNADYQYIVSTISKKSGNQFAAKHNAMIVSRLQRRYLDLKLPDFTAYFRYFRTNEKEETEKLVSLLTTHHTYFFREYQHFEYITNTILKDLIAEARLRPNKTINIWSAACSRGQEAYSLAMYLDFHLKQMAPDVAFQIVGTDIDRESVAIAKNGVYLREELKKAPANLIANHWAQGTGEISDYVKVKDSLKKFCKFESANLFEIDATQHKTSPIISGKKFDLIFCRNVFLYFNQQQIAAITKAISNYLTPTGYFFIGISETLHGLDVPLKSSGVSVYRLKTAESLITKEAPKAETKKPELKLVPSTQKPANPSAPTNQAPAILKVAVVDDSPTIHTLMKKLLTKELGFEISVHANSIKELRESIQKNKYNFDVMTLDIHMPEINGVEYLEKTDIKNHPPVIIVSSVARDDGDFAKRAINAGVADYVEKPSLQNIAELGDELRMKLKAAFSAKNSTDALKAIQASDFNKFEKLVFDKSKKPLRVLFSNYANHTLVSELLKGAGPDQPPCLVVFDNEDGDTGAITKTLGANCKPYASSTAFDSWAQITVMTRKEFRESVLSKLTGHKLVTIVVGEVSAKTIKTIGEIPANHVIIEDATAVKQNSALIKVANEIVPSTSFIYNSGKFLCTK